MELTKERWITIIASAAAVVFLGLYLFLYRPSLCKLKSARMECRSIETELSQAQEKIDSLRQTPIKKGLISEEEVSVAIDELTREGKSQGVNFISITPGKIEEPPLPYKILPIEMEIESSYNALGIFLGRLRDLEKSLVKVKKFNVTPHSLNPKILTTELVVNMYLSE